MSPSDEPGGLAGAVVLLVGVGEHGRSSGLRPVPAVRTTLDDLRWALVARCGVDPGAVIGVNPANPLEFGDAIVDAVEAAGDALVVYFVGHGLVNDRGALHLATRDTRVGRDHSALPYTTVRSLLKDSPARVRLVVLDCCFSGRAVDVLAARDDPAGLTDIDGVCVLTSAGRDELALAPVGARHTVFTGALITLLTDGDPDGPDRITLDSAVAYLRRRMRAANYPMPRYARTGRIGELVLAANTAPTGVPPAAPALASAAAGRFRGGWWPALLGALLAAPVVAGLVQRSLSWTPAGARGWLVSTPLRRVLVVAATAAAAVLLSRWIATAAAGLLARWAATSTVPWKPRGLGRWGPARRAVWRLVAPGRRRWSWRRVFGFVVPLVLAVTLGAGTLQAAAYARLAIAGCLPPAQLAVLTTPDAYESVLRLRDEFERTAANLDVGCPVVRIHVDAAPAATAATLLRGRWSDEARLAVGPSPDVWLPDSSLHLAGVRGVAPVVEDWSIAVSPIVLATPDANLPPTGQSLRQLVDGARDAGRPVVVPDPTASAVGGLARAALAADGTSVDGPFERALDQARTDAELPTGADVAALLCRYSERRPAVAMLLPEQAVVRFNRGEPTGGTCERPPDRGARLRLAYPKRTAVLDFPFVRLAWPGRSAAHTAGAMRFGAWLASADGRRILSRIGLRPPGFVSGGALTIDAGALPGAQFARVDPPDPDRHGEILRIYRTAQRPARVLLALDGSGSMGTRSAGRRRWDLAALAAADAVAMMRDADEFGVWLFQGDSAAGIRPMVPIGARGTPVGGQPRALALSGALAEVRVGGRTPLYDAVVRGVAEVGPTTEGRVTAVVVLTDGEDDNASGLSSDRYESAVRGQRVQVWVVAIGSATCRARALQTLPAATGGRCVEADPAGGAASVGAALNGVLRTFWQG